MVKNKRGNNNNFFLIAEAGINHGGNFQKAIKLITIKKICAISISKGVFLDEE